MDIYGILELIILATDIPSIPKQTKLQPPITFLLESELYISFFKRNQNIVFDYLFISSHKPV